MNILMLTPYLPFPLYSGGQIRTYNLLKNLSKKHRITLFAFIRNENERDHISRLNKFCEQVKVFKKRSPWHPKSLLYAAFSRFPLVVCLYHLKEVQEQIAKALEHNTFDLIHAETFYVMPNIPSSDIPVILAEQTIEYLVYKHYTESVKNPLLKILMKTDVAKIRYWESRLWRKARRVVAMSEADKTEMKRIVAGITVDLVPNGIDPHVFSANHPYLKKERRVLFVGNFKWLQNREAVKVLLENIWPIIHSQAKDVKLWIVGKSPPLELLKNNDQSVIVSSDIDDIRDAYHQSDVLLAPIYGPGGTRYKILESMASGLPVVTTPTGIEGLGARNGVHALVATSANDLAKETLRVLTNPSLSKKLSIAGRDFVVANFNWALISSKLDRIYQSVKQS